ncbi:MAG: ATP-dependent helicase HrpB [Deltaproteobacteria bacterium]|nr:ATP-dependent helicase HrpB [Deltaproteobacteria bacterium]
MAQNKVGGAQFNDVMAQQGVQGPNQVNATNPVADVTKVNEATKAADVLKTAQAQSVQGVNPDTGVKVVDKAAAARESGLKGLLQQVVDGQGKLDQVIKMATSGKTYGNQELLAIQAAVYKFSQELEMTSKVVEKATSGVKQTMQTQV